MLDYPNLLDYIFLIMENLISTKKLIEEFITLVKIDSEDLECSKIQKYLIRTFEKRFKVKVIKQKTMQSSNLLINVEGDKSLKPLLLSAHMDTVSPGKNINPVISKDKITSDGKTILGADNKSAIAVFLQALEILKKKKAKIRPLEILLTYGEEQGLLGARNFDFSLLKSREGLCFDSGGSFGRITIAAPWYASYTITFQGKASHAGIAPEKGINAIKSIAELITKLPSGRLDKYTTANVGTIKGGRQNNIIPDTAIITGELRSLKKENINILLEKIKDYSEKIAKKTRCKKNIKIKHEFSGFYFSLSDPLIKSVTETMKKMSVKPVFEKHNGGSDANIFNGHGIKTLNLSIGMQNVHTVNEYITIKDFVNALRFLVIFLESSRGVLKDA